MSPPTTKAAELAEVILQALRDAGAGREFAYADATDAVHMLVERLTVAEARIADLEKKEQTWWEAVGRA